MTRTLLVLCMLSTFIVGGCSDDSGTDPGADATDTSSMDVTADASDDAATDTEPEGDTEGADTATDTPGTDTSTSSVLVECHGLAYQITCDKPDVDANGYYACSDYFGDTTGVEAQCSANPNVDVRNGGPPCSAYTHYVGSCVYYNEALSDRCYVTHVGADSADRVEAGRAFWQTACAGEWIEGE